MRIDRHAAIQARFNPVERILAGGRVTDIVKNIVFNFSDFDYGKKKSYFRISNNFFR